MDLRVLFVPPMSWDEFRASTPPRSVALDGFVDGPPAFDPAGPHANFDHHSGVDRLSTRATCGQVLLAIRMGLFQTFKDESGQPDVVIYVNDCDEDVCLATYLLRNPRIAADLNATRLTELVVLADVLDTTAGGYPMPLDKELMRQLAWIFAPYRDARANGALYQRRSPGFYREIIDAVGDRIDAYLNGTGGRLAPDGRYEQCGGGPEWAMIREIGVDGRPAAIADGVVAYVLIRQQPQQPGERWVYSIGRTSPFVNFPVLLLLEALNRAEGSPEHRWGGSDLAGGSPRATGSRLTPEQVEQVINETLALG